MSGVFRSTRGQIGVFLVNVGGDAQAVDAQLDPAAYGFAAEDRIDVDAIAPGGAVQAMLEHGLKVIGVDPAEMAPAVPNDPNFQHIKKRGRDVRRKEFGDARWLMSDANVAPVQMLDGSAEAAAVHEAIFAAVDGFLRHRRSAERENA